MYVKVHKKGTRWFRDDTRTLIGEEISTKSPTYKQISKVIGKCILLKDASNKIVQVYRGYFASNGKFLRLGYSEPSSEKTCGFYVFVLR